MNLTVANMLTLARLVLAPVFVVLFLMGFKLEAFVVFCVAGFTDLIDGSVARLLKQPSKGGAILDPIADKILMQSCFVLLLLNELIPLWFFLMAFIRDAMIIGGIIYLERRKAVLPYKPIWVSKFATLAQLAVAVLALLIWWRGGFANISYWFMASIIIAAVLIASSGFQYVKMGLVILENNHRSKNRRS